MNNSENIVKLHYPVIAPLIMGKGIGDGRTTMCVMAQAAVIDALRKGLTLDKPTDEMECACRLLRKIAITLNDGSWWKDDLERTDTLRPLIPFLLDSNQSPETTKKRQYFLANNSVKVLTPMRLEWIAVNSKNEKIKENSAEGIKKINDLAELTSEENCLAAKEVLAVLKKDAYAYAYAYAYANVNANANAEAYANAYVNADAYANAYVNANAYVYANAYANANADADAYAYANANAEAYANAYAQKIKYRDAMIKAFYECAKIID